MNGKTRDVAIKQQKEDPERDPKLKVMEGDFITEGHVQAGLNHPNVVTQIGIVFSDHDPLAGRNRLIVLELVKGGELHDFLERRQHRPTEVEEITDMLRSVRVRLTSGLGFSCMCCNTVILKVCRVSRLRILSQWPSHLLCLEDRQAIGLAVTLPRLRTQSTRVSWRDCRHPAGSRT